MQTFTILMAYMLAVVGLPLAGIGQHSLFQVAPVVPELSIASNIEATAGDTVVVPIRFTTNGAQIASTVFSVDYDETQLSLNPADANSDGVPDAIQFTLPEGFQGSVRVSSTDTDGELDFLIADLSVPLGTLRDGVLAEVIFTTAEVSSVTTATVTFATNPPATFGSITGQDVPGVATSGSVRITPASTASPVLSIPSTVVATAGRSLAVPLRFRGNSTQIASTAFSVNYDETLLSFDPADANNDGMLDAIQFALPAGFQGSIHFNSADTDGELDFFVGDLSPPLGIITDGVLVEITFIATNVNTLTTAAVTFSTSPPATFGNINGGDVPGTASGGSIRIMPDTSSLKLYLPFLRKG